MPQKKSLAMCDFSDESDGSLSAPPSKKAKKSKDSQEYIERRERNNIAVRKSREKSRAKAKETIAQVTQLRAENEMLEQKVQLLSKELSVLKDLFLAHAGSVDSASPPTLTVTVSDHQYSANAKDEK